MQRNTLILVVVLVLSFVLAPCFGTWYDKISPQYGGWITSKEDAVTFVGALVAYVFLVPFLFKLFGHGNKKKWIGILLIPPALLWLSSDLYHIYLPIILGLIAFYFAKVILMIYSKTKTSHV